MRKGLVDFGRAGRAGGLLESQVGVSPLASASRMDSNIGIVEAAGFIGPPGERIFSVTSLPLGEPRGAVVIAPSLLTDRVRMYRAEVALARQLASAGFAVKRFDYRGFGHSDGETGEADMGTMISDLSLAIADTRQAVGAAPLAVVGCRFGSLIVAESGAVAERFVLWNPVLSGREYFRSAFRAQMVSRLGRGGSSAAPSRELEERSYANVLGYRVSQRLVSGTESARVDSARWRPGVPVLWLETAEELTTARLTAAEALKDRGLRVEFAFSASEDAGWFVGVRPFEDPRTTESLLTWVQGI